MVNFGAPVQFHGTICQAVVKQLPRSSPFEKETTFEKETPFEKETLEKETYFHFEKETPCEKVLS